MGANGSHASGVLFTDEGRKYRTLFMLGNNIKVLEMKSLKQGGKLPEESRTPNRIYVSIAKDGKNIYEIAKYGSDGKKLWEIHTGDHHGISPHYHIWENGKPKTRDAYALTPQMKKLLKKIQNYGEAK